LKFEQCAKLCVEASDEWTAAEFAARQWATNVAAVAANGISDRKEK
jgi:hypothetical protein